MDGGLLKNDFLAVDADGAEVGCVDLGISAEGMGSEPASENVTKLASDCESSIMA